MSQTALLVLDMLNDFVDGRLANEAAKPIIDPIGDLAAAARDRDDWMVVYGNDAHRPRDFELEVFGEHAMVGTEGAAVIDELAPGPADVVVPKRSYSAFSQTDLDATCRTNDIDRVVLVDQHTDCCCRHTAYDAFRRGLEVAVVENATAVYGPFDPDSVAARQQAALDYLDTYYNAEILAADPLV